MAKSTVNHALPEPRSEYYPEEGILYVDNGKPFGEGETIAKGLVVFYDRENDDEVVGMCIETDAESVRKPFVDAILAKYGIHPEDTPPAASKSAIAPDRPNESPITPTPKHAR